MPLPAVLVTPWPPSRTAQVLHPRRACSSGGCFSADLVRASVALFKSSCFSKGRKQSHCLGTRSLTTASLSYPASCPPRAGLSSAAHPGTRHRTCRRWSAEHTSCLSSPPDIFLLLPRIQSLEPPQPLMALCVLLAGPSLLLNCHQLCPSETSSFTAAAPHPHHAGHMGCLLAPAEAIDLALFSHKSLQTAVCRTPECAKR